MQKKWNTLAVCSFVIAIVIFLVTYILFHYMGSDGCFVSGYQSTPGKPFVTLLFGVWGVMFLFTAVISFVIGRIFCSKEEK